MKKTPFLKELEKAQEYFVNRKGSENDHAKSRYYVNHIKLKVAVSESDYIQMLKDRELKARFEYIRSMTGLSLRLDRQEIALHVYFPHDVFFCFHIYYGELLRRVKERLQWELGNQIQLDIHGEIPALRQWKDIEREISQLQQEES